MRFIRFMAVLLTATTLFSGCKQHAEPEATMKTQEMPPQPTIIKKPFGRTTDGVSVDLYTLRNKNGLETSITNYGGIVVTLRAPDRNGKLDDIVLGYDNLEGYLKSTPYFGAIIGRYGNRIAKGRFALDGKDYKLAVNNGENSLHGGLKGFDKVVWQAAEIKNNDSPGLRLSYLSKDGEEGYPGNLSVTVTYTLTANDELKVDYTAVTDKKTVLNLTNHSYFNLAGKGDILKHELTLNADRFTPVDKGLIPTGELRPVKGTALDFTKAAVIGARIDEPEEQVKLGGGYDHNFVINNGGSALTTAATVFEPGSGRVLEVSTTEPGVQFYTGNFLDGSITGKGGQVYQKRSAFCLETQHYPDSPNKPGFPSTVLEPGKEYRSTTIYKFSHR
jgi:aldose 1-epimerase